MRAEIEYQFKKKNPLNKNFCYDLRNIEYPFKYKLLGLFKKQGGWESAQEPMNIRNGSTRDFKDFLSWDEEKGLWVNRDAGGKKVCAVKALFKKDLITLISGNIVFYEAHQKDFEEERVKRGIPKYTSKFAVIQGTFDRKILERKDAYIVVDKILESGLDYITSDYHHKVIFE